MPSLLSSLVSCRSGLRASSISLSLSSCVPGMVSGPGCLQAVWRARPPLFLHFCPQRRHCSGSWGSCDDSASVDDVSEVGDVQGRRGAPGDDNGTDDDDDDDVDGAVRVLGSGGCSF